MSAEPIFEEPAGYEPAIVRTKAGDVRGFRDRGVLVWRSIPYAAPPRGALRFRSPEPAQPWDDIRDCSEFGDIAPQGAESPVPVGKLAVGEDCLSVNVWSPGLTGEPRPVLVWLHGGAYCLGSAAQEVYDGRNISDIGGVVVVGINFRLGVLGFTDLSSFSTPEHVFESNVGLRDQIAGLEWVRDNIAGFGGDPGNVTVFGESSGAGCVTTLMTSPRAEGLFDRAIAQSPPATCVYGPERAAGVARRFLELVDLTPDRIGELFELPIGTIIEASDKLVDEIPAKAPGTLACAPVVDGEIVPEYPVLAFQQGRSHRIPLIIGTNHDEASLFRLFKSPIMPVTPDAVNEMFRGIAADHPDLSPDRVAAIAAAYPDITTARGAVAISQDAAFKMPALWIADAHSKHSPTWMYRFDYATPMLRAARVGAGHATELPYVFGNFGTLNIDPTFWLGGRKTAYEISGRMQRRWLAFAAYGVPAALDGSKHWAPYEESERRTLILNAADTVERDPDKEFREAWGDQPMSFS